VKSRSRSIHLASVLIMVLALAGLRGVADAATVVQAPARASTEAEPFTVVTATVGDDMRVTLDRYSAPAGDVRFYVTNSGKLTHELVVLKTDLPADKLVASTEVPGKVVEQVHMGETGDIEGGRFNGLQLQLGSGSYVILCNELGHYMAGMHVAFTVTQPVVNVTLDDRLTITLDRTTIYEGPVVFAVTNRGAMTHELLVMATSVAPENMPADPEVPAKVSEDTNIGETGDVPAGRFSGLGITLAPGIYTLICNEPGHFAGGMHHQLIVLPAPAGDE
jgi:uncharacterized cupredoxin-like copper-binding protein